MQRSKAEIYLHFVWTTHRRLPLIAPEIEPRLYGCILRECRRLGCEVLAIGGIPDHVHLAVKVPTTVAPATLMQRVKGVSSTVARERLLNPGATFAWQEGYGVFSISRSHLPKVIAYVRNQKSHHGAGTLWTEWERSSAENAEDTGAISAPRV